MASSEMIDAEEFDRLLTTAARDAAHRYRGAGALSLLTDETAVAAAPLVLSGRRVALGRPWETTGSADNRKPVLHYLSKIDEPVGSDAEPTLYCDFVGTDYHDKRVTHVDALNHVAYRGRFFGGEVATDLVASNGVGGPDITRLRPIITRGVLLDMARAAGVPWVEPGTGWSRTDVDTAVELAGVELRPGDAVLLRSGSPRRRLRLGTSDPDVSCGLHVDALLSLAERGVAVLGADDSNDVRPSAVTGVSLPVHAISMVALGMALIDNLDLEALAATCAELGRWEFLFTLSPLVIPLGTGSPVNPLAVF